MEMTTAAAAVATLADTHAATVNQTRVYIFLFKVGISVFALIKCTLQGSKQPVAACTIDVAVNCDGNAAKTEIVVFDIKYEPLANNWCH